MAVIRGPKKPAGRTDPPSQAGRRAADPYAEKTLASKPGGRNSAAKVLADDKTRLGGARAPGRVPFARDHMDDPVVGWLVIVAGPGKGRSLKIGYGQNSIGRSAAQRIQIDFGDSLISRDQHAFLTYDPKGRKFYIANGGGPNLVYLGDNPVLAPTEISAHTQFTLGGTTLRFVPLCGAAFDWQDGVAS